MTHLLINVMIKCNHFLNESFLGNTSANSTKIKPAAKVWGLTKEGFYLVKGVICFRPKVFLIQEI